MDGGALAAPNDLVVGPIARTLRADQPLLAHRAVGGTPSTLGVGGSSRITLPCTG
ncbi:hypothetical protein NLX85_00180 [Micromonospora sp. A3M-1-15]|uniref:hypothetical protein n=1 Tax=Micromonospora sp. A3M-1-15 TaxID=2962035 RepID=UPI0020B83465|nr:hypothetical protein [Micromonospora sp. A3M-1-15]MCP3781785.1 hypothetical protein [Micromonospora sp. A3M-1-15]